MSCDIPRPAKFWFRFSTSDFLVHYGCNYDESIPYCKDMKKRTISKHTTVNGRIAQPATDTQDSAEPLHQYVTTWEQRFRGAGRLADSIFLVSGIIKDPADHKQSRCCSYQKYKTNTWN